MKRKWDSNTKETRYSNRTRSWGEKKLNQQWHRRLGKGSSLNGSEYFKKKTKNNRQSCLFIYFFSLRINLSPFFSACTGTREHMNNTLPRPKRYKGLYAQELTASIKNITLWSSQGWCCWLLAVARGNGNQEVVRSGSAAGWASWRRREDEEKEQSKTGLGPGWCRSSCLLLTWTGVYQKIGWFLAIKDLQWFNCGHKDLASVWGFLCCLLEPFQCKRHWCSSCWCWGYSWRCCEGAMLREKSSSCFLTVILVTRKEFPAGCLAHLFPVRL